MKEVSNKTLVILILIAVSVSFGGTIISLTKIGSMMGVPEISGFGTTGEVNVTITESLSLNLSFPNIRFGSGYVHSTHDYATIDTEKGVTTGWSESISGSGIVIENTGGDDINVSFSLNDTSANFIGGTDPRFEWKGAENESDSCDDGIGSLITTWTLLSEANANYSVCHNLSNAAAKDTLDFYVNLTIPDDAEGSKRVTITFTASSPE